MSYSDIRKELYEKGLDKAVVDLIISRIDEQILNKDVSSIANSIKKEYQYLAWALILISIGVFAIFFYHSIIFSIIMFIPFSGIISGVTILFMMRESHNQTNVFQDSRDKYRRKK